MRPKPRIPRVFSYTSTPPNFERSQRWAVSEACACGTLRARARISAIVCSAAAIVLDCGALAGADTGAELDVVPELRERLLESGQRDDAVEGPEVPAVGDAQDAALELALAAVGRDAALAQQPGDLGPVDALGQLDRGHHGRALVGIAEQVEAEAGGPRAGGAREQIVAGEYPLQSLLL